MDGSMSFQLQRPITQSELMNNPESVFRSPTSLSYHDARRESPLSGTAPFLRPEDDANSFGTPSLSEGSSATTSTGVSPENSDSFGRRVGGSFESTDYLPWLSSKGGLDGLAGSIRPTRWSPLTTSSLEYIFKCGWNTCQESYQSLRDLNLHVIAQSHGSERALDGDMKLLELKRNHIPWNEIAENFPGMPSISLQIRYWELSYYQGKGTSVSGDYDEFDHITCDIVHRLLRFRTKSSSGSLARQLALVANYDLRSFMLSQYGSTTTRLSSVITLTGNSQCAQATTCGDYLTRTWLSTGPAFLGVLQKALDVDDWSTSKAPGVEISAKVYRSGQLEIRVAGGPEAMVEVAQQLVWLGSALQTSQGPQLGYSQCSTIDSNYIIDDDPSRLRVCVAFSKKPLVEEAEEACWHPLFTNAVLVKGFPIEVRGSERGLEIPLQMMAALTGVRHAAEFEGGLLLKGHSSAFIPVKRYANSIQWHYLANAEDERLSFRTIGDRFPGRALLDEVGYEAVSKFRCFVGWWSTTTTHLGTEDANYENLDWSEAKELGRSPSFRGGALGFQNIVTAELNFSLGLKDGKLHVRRDGPYHSIIRSAAKTPVVLYDFPEKRAWLVPASAVILHIAKTRHFKEHYAIGDKPVEFPAVLTAQAEHGAAAKVLIEQAAFKVSSDGYSLSRDTYLRDIVRDIWSLLEMVLDKNVSKDITSDTELRGTFRDFLRGWEFMDLVENTSPMKLKEVHILKSAGGWPDLARDIDAIVLFASGFEDIIRPAVSEMLCHKWKGMPKEKDYLAVSVPTINYLFDRAGSHLTRKYLTSSYLQWHQGPKLWEGCNHLTSFHCHCDRLQQLAYESNIPLGSNVANESLIGHTAGALVFGKSSLGFKLQTPACLRERPQNIYSQPNVALLSPDLVDSKRVILSLTDVGQGRPAASVSPSPNSSTDSADSSNTSMSSISSPPTEISSDEQYDQGVRPEENGTVVDPRLNSKRRYAEDDTPSPFSGEHRKQRIRFEQQAAIMSIADSCSPYQSPSGGGSVARTQQHADNAPLSLRRKSKFEFERPVPS